MTHPLISRAPVLFGAALLAASVLNPASAGRPAKEPVSTLGKIVHVDDGDTVVLLTDRNEQMKIRLASIDAPESSHTNKERGRIGQPYSENSKRYLSSLVKGVRVDARCYEQDRYGRSVCELFVGDINVNAMMVRHGWAWVNEASNGRYVRDKSLREVERQARAERVGLWAGRTQVEPWEWRKVCWQDGNCPN